MRRSRSCNGPLTPGSPGQASTVEVFMAWWLDHVVPGTVTDETVTRYRWITDHWITPHVGMVRLNKRTPTHVPAMLVRLEEAGLSPKSRTLARSVLARALRWAARLAPSPSLMGSSSAATSSQTSSGRSMPRKTRRPR
jgi:hypothetical protein